MGNVIENVPGMGQNVPLTGTIQLSEEEVIGTGTATGTGTITDNGIHHLEQMVKHQTAIAEEAVKSAYPTVVVELPSGGLLYPPENPLSLGKLEMKYMTAKEEDILTTEQYIKSGIVLDRLFQSLIVTKIDYDSMLVGDRTAVMLAARIHGYGAEYETKITTPSGDTKKVLINLEDFKAKEVDTSAYVRGVNEFTFTTKKGNVIKFKLLTNGDQKHIDAAMKKYRRPDSRDIQMTARLAQMIISVDGNTDDRFIKLFIENEFLAIDTRNFRKFVSDIQPDIDLEIDMVDESTGEPFRAKVAVGLDFFWPDARI